MTDVREKLLRNQLQKVAIEQKYDDPDIETAAVPTTGSNFTFQLFLATIKSTGKEDLNVFAKVAVVGETMREQTGLNMFDVEKYFYTNLAKKYKKIEDKHDLPAEHRLVTPKFYGYSNEYLKEVLVLQDLSKDGFVTYDRLESIELEYTLKAIEQMSKIHALSLVYQKEYGEEFEEDKKTLRNRFAEDNGDMMEMFKGTMEKVIQMVREENKPKLQKFFLETFSPQSFMEFYEPKKRPVIIHCDYRQSNLMHKIDEDGKVQVVPVDYQTLQIGNVALDLLYFIFTSSDGAFRAQYYDQLVEHYYESLAAALRRLNLDPDEAFPRTDFDEELKEMLPFGLVISSMVLPIITIDLGHVTEIRGGEFEFDSVDTMVDLMSNVNELCAQRFNEIVDDYVRWGVI